MTDEMTFEITYWGTTGAYACPLRPDEFSSRVRQAIRALAERDLLGAIQNCHADDAAVANIIEHNLPLHLHSTWGGNTTCIQVETPDAVIVIDTGSGFIELGRQLQQRWSSSEYVGKREAHILLTHSHMDHTYGVPFADAGFDVNNKFIVWSSQQVLDGLHAVMGQSATAAGVFFPQSYELLPALRDFRPVEVPGEFRIGETRITTHALNHPGHCTGYRLSCRNRSVVFAFDHETATTPDTSFAEWAAAADLLCIDAQYRQQEYEGEVGIMGSPPAERSGWGHGTVEAAIATGVAARVKRLALVHREPTRSDRDLATLQASAREQLRDALQAAGLAPDSCSVGIPFEGETVRV